MTLEFSLSAFQAWQRCEQRYYYQYVRRLRTTVKDVAPMKGTILHDYLASYYLSLKNGDTPLVAHGEAITAIRRWTPQANLAKALAVTVGDMESASNYSTLIANCESIATRYYRVKGQADAATYEVLMVEEKVRLPIAADIWTTCVIDLVVRQRSNGVVYLVEHKSTANVPNTSLRIRDMQTLLYAEIVKRQFGLQIDGILWNYIRTKIPTVPKVNKDGSLSQARDIDTTWEVYQDEIAKHALNVADYTKMFDILKDKETDVFFPRYEHVIVADTKLMLSDYITEAQRARLSRTYWEAGKSKPIRSLQRDCDFCSFYKACEAVVTGGDEDTALNMYYTTEREDKPDGRNNSTTGSTTSENLQAGGAEISVQPDYLRPLWGGEDVPTEDDAR